MPSEDMYGELVEIMGEYSDGDKAYYQEMDDDYILLGEPVEIDLNLQDNGDYGYEDVVQTSVFYPLSSNYLFIYEHNGETAIKQNMWKNGNQLMVSLSIGIGKTASIEWPGFKNGDKILLSNGITTVTVNPVITESGLSFEVPSNGIEAGMTYDIWLQRYENYATYIGYLAIDY